MAQLSKEELLTIARLSGLHLSEQEIVPLADQITTILNYVDQLEQASIIAQAQTVRNKNIFRDDIVKKTDPDPFLELAPKREGRYFVVPKILE